MIIIVMPVPIIVRIMFGFFERERFTLTAFNHLFSMLSKVLNALRKDLKIRSSRLNTVFRTAAHRVIW